MSNPQPQQWTPEPWLFDTSHPEWADYVIWSDNDPNNTSVIAYVLPDDHDEHPHNARRIVACVNAMQGITDPQAFRDAAVGFVLYWDSLDGDMAELTLRINDLRTALGNPS